MRGNPDNFQIAGGWNSAAGRFEIGYFSGTGYAPLQGFSPPLSLFSGDIDLEFDVVDDTAKLTIWSSGTQKPASPQLVADISAARAISGNKISEGTIGAFVISRGAVSALEIRQFSAIPEPSTAALGSLGVVAIAGLVFRNRLNRAAR